MNNIAHRPRGMMLVEITPVIAGGDPSDAHNKMWVNQQQHFEMVRYWNRVLSEFRDKGRNFAIEAHDSAS